MDKQQGVRFHSDNNHAHWLDRKMLRLVRSVAGPAAVRFAVGKEQEQTAEALPGVRFSDLGSAARLAIEPEMAFGDGYAAGKIQVDGSLADVLGSLYRSAGEPSWYSRLLSRWLGWIQENTLDGSRRNIHEHYDLPSDFYALWLDTRMLYTCAYFSTPETTLEEAQEAKLELVCRKLWLRPGETVVEAGCGWGGFALYMAQHYGVKVRAFNVSQEQIGFARGMARRLGITNQVEFVEDDYRNISGKYDVFVSLGMLEHVGKPHHHEFADVVHKAIGAQGRALLHFIGRNQPKPLSVWIRRRVFPGAYPPALTEAMQMLQPFDFSVLDVENLRLHYAKTLQHWLARFEQAIDIVQNRFGREFARRWHLYLAGSEAAFLTGSLQLFQIVLAGSQCKAVPWTRPNLYGHATESAKDALWTQSMF